MKNKTITLSCISFLLLSLLSFNIISCSCHSPNPNTTSKKTTIDTIITDTIIPQAKSKSKLQQEKDDGVLSNSDILDDQLSSYKDTVKIDTTFLLKGHDMMTVKLRHYCTYDNKINLPTRYLKIYNLTEFHTHNFLSALNVKINSKEIFNGFIKKEDFEKLLDDELRKYAILLYPNVHLSNDRLEIQYSISVPLSDVGKGFTIQIDNLGNKHVTAD